MEQRFSNFIKDHYFSLKCMPHDTARQKIEFAGVDAEPVEMRSSDIDSFGNSVIIGHTIKPHDTFNVRLTGTALTGLEVFEEKSEDTPMIFTYPSRATRPGIHLSHYHNMIANNAPDGIYQRALYYMRCIYRDFSYCPGATSISTTAENAVQLGKGVCQDYAHIMLALCRLDHIPARYAVGIMTGEGFSHAWVEVKCRQYWYGFDPTNNCLVDDNYIKISHGRDYFDTLVNKGIYHNPAVEVQRIRVEVIRL